MNKNFKFIIAFIGLIMINSMAIEFTQLFSYADHFLFNFRPSYYTELLKLVLIPFNNLLYIDNLYLGLLFRQMANLLMFVSIIILPIIIYKILINNQLKLTIKKILLISTMAMGVSFISYFIYQVIPSPRI